MVLSYGISSWFIRGLFMSNLFQKTILLIEDDEIIGLGESMNLKEHGYNVIHAADGRKAIDIVFENESNIDLILMDINLGNGIDGTETARRILKEKNIPIVFLSSHTEAEIVDKTEEITSYGYVVKNSSPAVLLASIKMAFKLFEANKRSEESERKYCQIVQNTRTAVIISKEDRIVFTNGAAMILFGYSEEDFKSCVFENLIHPDDLCLFLTYNENRIEEEKARSSCSFRIVRNDASIRYVEMNTAETVWKGKPAVINFINDMTERKQSEDELKRKTALLEAQLNSSIEGILIVDDKGKKILQNQNVVNQWKIPQHIADNSDDRQQVRHVKEMTKKPEQFLEKITYLYAHPEGISRDDVELIDGTILDRYSAPVFGKDDKYYGRIWAFRDITERKRAEYRIQNLLNEKEIILKEVHHRIKNNMNTLISLLSIQAIKQGNPPAKNILLNATGRVKIMMTLYDTLYLSNSINEASLKDYIPYLLRQISDIFQDDVPAKFETRIDDIVLTADMLSPLGIIINELVSNAMKYAMRDRPDGVIRVEALKKDGHVSLIIQDNGPGIPESISFKNSSGFGLQLVEMLAAQMKGSVSIERINGTKIILEF